MIEGQMRLDFPYLVPDPDRHGNERYYVRMKGLPKVRIRAKFGTEAFVAEYWAARKRNAPQIKLSRDSKPGTLRYLIDQYMASSDFLSLDANSTQVLRARILGKLIETAGDKGPLLSPKSIKKGVKRRSYGAAKDFLTTLRGLYKWAFEEDLVASDPTASVHLKRRQTDGFHPWTLAECLAYEKHWPLGTRQRTAYAIGRYTAQRGSDAVRLGRPMERDGKLVLRQWKNRTRKPVDVIIPVVAPLREALDAWQGSGDTWLETPDGKPYTADGFRIRFREWCDKAGLPANCSFHGLRKATAARMAERGKTPHEIMAALGHSTHQQAATYTRTADRERMAAEAFTDLFESPNVSPISPVRQKDAKNAG